VSSARPFGCIGASDRRLHDPPIATYAIVILIGLAMNYVGNRSSV
jgi:hypothetical protein